MGPCPEGYLLPSYTQITGAGASPLPDPTSGAPLTSPYQDSGPFQKTGRKWSGAASCFQAGRSIDLGALPHHGMWSLGLALAQGAAWPLPRVKSGRCDTPL